MRASRYSIAAIMWVIFVTGFGLAALKSASETWTGITYMVTCSVLALAVIGAVCRPRGERAYWLGFALFGCGYMYLAFAETPGIRRHVMPTVQLLRLLASKLEIPNPVPRGGFGRMTIRDYFMDTGQCLWSLLLGTLGGFLTLAFAGSRPAPVVAVDAAPEPTPTSLRSRWRRPSTIAFGGALGVVLVTLIAYPRAPELVSSLLYLATCALVGLTIVGVAMGRKSFRAEWLGMAVFAGGYLYAHFGWIPSGDAWSPYQPTSYVLAALRPALASSVRVLHKDLAVKAAENDRIVEALEQPIPMRFPNETPLEDVLKSIRKSTARPGYEGIPIYIDPVALQESEKTLTSPITLELEGVPLKTTLRLLLKQLGLGYVVQNGMLTIAGEEEGSWNVDDPYYLVGHTLLAWLAAGLGGVLAPLVAEPRRSGVTALGV